MKTTKKQIREIVNKGTATDIHRLFVKIHNGVHDRGGIYQFVKEFATSKRRRMQAYEIAYGEPKRVDSELYLGKHGYFKPLPRQAARIYFQREFERKRDNYTKVATLGNTWLYCASPIYRHQDYNKSRILEIFGNEKTVLILCAKYGK